MKCKFVSLAIITSFLAVGPAAFAGKPEPLPPRQLPMSKLQLQIWNSPEFQKKFAESYIAETEIEPRVTEDERETMQKILELISSDKMGEAAKMLEKNMTDASSAVFDFTLANIHFQQEEFDQAVEFYNSAVEKHPKFQRAWKNMALIHIRRDDHAKAIPAFTRVIELGGGDALTFGLLGFAYSSVGNSISAESAYRMANLLDPNTLDWKMGMARSFFRQERYAAAAALCANLIEREPDNDKLWMLQANAYLGMKKPLEAAKNFETIDSLGKSTPASLRLLGDIYINEGLYDTAVAAYARAIRMTPEADSNRAIRAAKVLAAHQALAAAETLIATIEDARRQHLNDETKKELLKIRARIAVAKGEGEAEAQILERIVAIDPLDGDALILLGQHARRSDKPEKAVFYYERAAGIEGFEAEAKLRHGQLLVGQGKYAEALPLLRRAQQIEPRDEVQRFLDEVERIAKNQ